MSAILTAALLVALCGVLAGGSAPWLLRRAVEPELEPGDVKTPYAALATRRTAVGVGLWAAALATVAVTTVEPARLGPWLVVAVVGALTAVVDIATTWIPRRWLHLGWAATAAAVLGSAWSTGDWGGLLRAALGVLIVGGAYGAVYAVSQLSSRGMFGFADVRLAILAGMVGGWRSLATVTSGMVLGALVGAVWGVVVALRRRRNLPYAYGPSIVLGPYLALAVGLLTTR